jgi:4-amino-4-deoxychorismate lyase
MKSKYPYLINGDFNHVITPLDRGFSYGDGVFRTMLIRNSQPDNWPLHYQKLVADCAAIGIVCPSAELLMSDMLQLFTADISDKSSEVAKIIITRGEGERGYAQPAITNPTRVVLKSAMPRYSTDNQINGVQLHLCQTRLADQGKLAGIKHLNRLENVIARMEWHDDKIFDGILLDQKDMVTYLLHQT